MVQSVPLELSTDHTLLITFAQDTKCVSVSQIRESLGWPESRTMAALVRTGASSRNVSRWLIHLCRMSFCKKASCGWTIKAQSESTTFPACTLSSLSEPLDGDVCCAAQLEDEESGCTCKVSIALLTNHNALC